MKKKAKKSLLLLLVVGGIVGASVGAYYIGKNSASVNKTEAEVNVINENGIKVHYAFEPSNTSALGVLSFTYKVEPASYSDSIEVKMNWTDSSITEETSLYYTFSHDKTNKKIEVTCLNECDKQLTLCIYSNVNDLIEANVTVDYKQKIQGVTASCLWGDNITSADALQFTTIKSIGSIANESTVEVKILKFNTDFINFVVTQFSNTLSKEVTTADIYFDSNTIENLHENNLFYSMFQSGQYEMSTNSDDNFILNYIEYQSLSTNAYPLDYCNAKCINDYLNGDSPIFDYTVSVENVEYTGSINLNIQNSLQQKTFGVTPNQSGLIF